MASSKSQIKSIVTRLNKVLADAANPQIYKYLADFSVKLIVKRTRLGYGVDGFLEQKHRLNPLSMKYVDRRKKLASLSKNTSPGKSNLTLTNQMLESVRVLKVTNRGATIGPSGGRNDSRSSNQDIARFNAEKGRVFLNLSDLEFAQMFREYRRVFGDLLKKQRLLK